MALFQVKAIKAKKMNLKQVRQELLNELRNQGKAVEKQYAEIVKGWNGAKPKFESLIGLEGGSKGHASVLTGPTGSDEAVNKFVWLDEGTKIRWALMSSNWRSKTKPGVLKSGRGRGRVLIAGRRAMSRRGIGPRPGIKARKWTQALQKQRRKPFTKAMISAVNRGMGNIYK